MARLSPARLPRGTLSFQLAGFHRLIFKQKIPVKIISSLLIIRLVDYCVKKLYGPTTDSTMILKYVYSLNHTIFAWNLNYLSDYIFFLNTEKLFSFELILFIFRVWKDNIRVVIAI